MGGFWPGNRSSFRRIRGFRRTSLGLIKSTYTIPEKKYADVASTGTVTSSGSVQLLNGLSLGTAVSNRIGRQIVIKGSHFKLAMTGSPNSATPTTPMVILRIMLLWDAQPNAALPSNTDILETVTAPYQTAASQAMKFATRFKILFDKRYCLNNQTTATSSQAFSTQFDENFTKLNLKTQYANSNNGDITDIETGALLFFAISDATATANNPVLTMYHRLRYVDN